MRKWMSVGVLCLCAPWVFAQGGVFKHMPKLKPVPVAPHVQQQLAQQVLRDPLQQRVEKTTLALLEKASLENSALHRPHFNVWVKQATQHNQLTGKSTFQALHRVDRLLTEAHQKYQLRPLRKLLKEISYYKNILGRQDDFFYKLYYQREEEFTGIPRAENFYLLAERRGLEADSPEVLRAKALARQHTCVVFHRSQERVEVEGKWTKSPYISIIDVHAAADIGTVRQELEALLDALTPEGFEVRMNRHELGIRTLPSGAEDRTAFRQGQLHIHVEFIPPEDLHTFFVQTSIELWLNVQEFTVDPQTGRPLSDRQIAQQYLQLFGKYLTSTGAASGTQTLQALANGK